MKRSTVNALILLALALSPIAIALSPAPVDARQLFQHVLLRVGTPTSPVDVRHHDGALQTFALHPNRIECHVAVSTATTIQALGGSCVAPGAGLSLYLTDVLFGTSAAAGTAADSFPTLKYGTGGTCGTGTAVIWQALTTANSTVIADLSQPIKLPANNELCWMMSTAGSKVVQVSGFIAP